MIGQTISHFKVIEKIGQGGMGVVYRAQDTNLSRDVAIKVLPEQFTQDPQRLARFEREAKLLASLNHPNIAAIHSFEHSDEIHFLVLELVEGETLAERVAKGPVPVEEALEVCRQIAEGVEAAHEKGVIHRDLKPANVKVTPEGKVKILDFGLAKAFEGEVPVADISQSPTLTEEMTRAGVILGTAAYMSPEQARGKPVDKRTDIFAFGCVLYELLTGKRAFGGETVTDVLAKVLEGEPDWNALPVGVPSITRFVLTRCLQKDPQKRLQHIDGARILIEEALTGSATVSPLGATIQTPLWKRAIPWSMAGVMAVIAISLAFWPSPQPVSLPSSKFVITPSPTAPLASNLENDLAISPDGRHLVYLGAGERGNQLYLRSLDDFVDKPISGTEGITRGSPFFSPDGKSVGFFAGNELKKVSLIAGSPITLCDAVAPGQSGSWGLDDTIVFSASNGSDVGLYRVAAAGGEPELLATPDQDKGEDRYWHPQILPGGKAVLFSIGKNSRNVQIAVLSLETGEQKILIEDGRQGKYVQTRHLIYEQTATGNLLSVRFDLATLEVTSGPVPVLQDVRQTAGSVDYALSEEGTLVYVPLTPDVQRLVWVDRGGTESQIIQDEVSFGNPRISPDGKQVAIAISKAGEPQNIWIYDLENESLRRLTFGYGSVETWSPDGQWIIFQSENNEGRRGISRQLADGSGPVEQLTTHASSRAQQPGSLTPDGSVLAFTDSSVDIWTLPMEGDGEPQPFITSPNIECCAQFSPDGKWLAYVSDELGSNQVYVSPLSDPDVKWLVSEEGGGEPVWSPNGTEIFYRSGNKMMVVSVQVDPTFRAGKPEVLFEGRYVSTRFVRGYQYYDISPDGRRFLMIKAVDGNTAQINVVLNWFEELKRLVPTDLAP